MARKNVGAFVQLMCATVLVAALLALCSCAGESAQPTSTDGQTSTDGGQTDELFSDDVQDAELYVFQIDDKSVSVGEYFYAVDILASQPLEDGHFYRVVADVTYLNGGIAGYVDYPEIHSVSSCEEVSPLDMDLPSVRDKAYGLLLIGDYTDGDVLFREMGTRAVWKDGAWAYRYDEDIELSDGTQACVREGVTEADVQQGMEQGVLSCEDYFVLPS